MLRSHELTRPRDANDTRTKISKETQSQGPGSNICSNWPLSPQSSQKCFSLKNFGVVRCLLPSVE